MKYLYASFILAILLTSCSRKEYMTKTPDSKVAPIAYRPTMGSPSFQSVISSAYRPANTTANPRQYYDNAYLQLKQMLDGQYPASFKDAVYATENAWYEGKLSYTKYSNHIKALAAICRAWKQTNKLNGYKENDSLQVALSGAIYKMMTDTIKDITGKVVTVPYHYDFNDPFGSEDWTNRFVNKLMETHGGNCHSLPFLYKILAEEMDIPAYLSFLPEHIYIKQYSKQYNWYNTELTSKSFPVDAWLMTTGCVSTNSIVSRIYMDTLGLNQSIAVCVNDLAKGYEKQFGNDNLQFILNCCELGLKYYPNYTELLLLKAETLKKLNQKETDKAVAQNINSTMEQTYAQLVTLDYREIPDVMYDRWNKSLVNGGNLIEDPTKEDSTIAPPNPFASLGMKTHPMLTLSHGEYIEVFEDDTLRRLGSVIFNTVTNKIAYVILNDDKKYGAELKRPKETSRFLSVDPLARQYPFYTPYQFSGNNPIACTDIDGKEPDKTLSPAEKKIVPLNDQTGQDPSAKNSTYKNPSYGTVIPTAPASTPAQGTPAPTQTALTPPPSTNQLHYKEDNSNGVQGEGEKKVFGTPGGLPMSIDVTVAQSTGENGPKITFDGKDVKWSFDIGNTTFSFPKNDFGMQVSIPGKNSTKTSFGFTVNSGLLYSTAVQSNNLTITTTLNMKMPLPPASAAPEGLGSPILQPEIVPVW